MLRGCHKCCWVAKCVRNSFTKLGLSNFSYMALAYSLVALYEVYPDILKNITTALWYKVHYSTIRSDKTAINIYRVANASKLTMSWKSLELNPMCWHFYYIDIVDNKSWICPFKESKRKKIFEIKSELCCRYLHFKECKPIFFKLLLVRKRQILFFSAPNLLQVLKDIKSLERAILALRQKLYINFPKICF